MPSHPRLSATFRDEEMEFRIEVWDRSVANLVESEPLTVHTPTEPLQEAAGSLPGAGQASSSAGPISIVESTAPLLRGVHSLWRAGKPFIHIVRGWIEACINGLPV